MNQDLKSHLWECAQILRGSAVDRTDWKGYILPLLFFKRISDVWDEETRANVGAALSHAMREIERANADTLYRVFGAADWGNREMLTDEILKDLMEGLSGVSLGNKAVS